LEEDVGAGGGGPPGGRDFDELALGVGEIEEDLAGEVAGASGTDTADDLEAGGAGVGGGAGFEEVEDGAEGVGSGDGVVFGEELGEEPLAVLGGADGRMREGLRRTKACPSRSVKGAPRSAMAMRGARSGMRVLLIPVIAGGNGGIGWESPEVVEGVGERFGGSGVNGGRGRVNGGISPRSPRIDWRRCSWSEASSAKASTENKGLAGNLPERRGDTEEHAEKKN